MKKLLLGSAVLALFSISITLFQISCQKESIAQGIPYVLPAATSSTLGGVIIGNGLSVTSNGTLSANSTNGGVKQLNKIVYSATNLTAGTPEEIFIADFDGSNQTKINIVIDGTVTSPRLSPDGSIIFFQALINGGNGSLAVYSCNVDGSNVKKVLDTNVNGQHVTYQFGGAY